jgi:hypothetical protein
LEFKTIPLSIKPLTLLIKDEDAADVKRDVTALKSEFQTIRHCFNDE